MEVVVPRVVLCVVTVVVTVVALVVTVLVVFTNVVVVLFVDELGVVVVVLAVAAVAAVVVVLVVSGAKVGLAVVKRTTDGEPWAGLATGMTPEEFTVLLSAWPRIILQGNSDTTPCLMCFLG